MRKPTDTCDNCGAARKQTNHWYLLNPSPAGFKLLRWNDVDAGVPGYLHICGQLCATECQARWMDFLPVCAVKVGA